MRHDDRSLQRTRHIAMPKIKTADGVNLYYEEAGAPARP
jgi:hypothetical protein